MGDIKDLSDSNFNSSIVTAKATAVVHFWATWCGGCRVISVALSECADEYTNVKFFRLNVDENTTTPSTYNIKGLPTLLFFKNGELSNISVGVITKSNLAKLIDKIT